jgi:hypothetical protein
MQVMLTMNVDIKAGLANGMRGVVIGFEQGENRPKGGKVGRALAKE